MPFLRFAHAYREAFTGLPRVAWLLAAVTLVNRSGTMVLPFLALYLTREKGFAVMEAGRTLSVYGLGALGGATLGGWLVDRLGARAMMASSLLLTGVGFLLLGRLDTRPAITIMMLCLSLVGEAFRPANAAALAEVSTPGERVRVFALNRLAVNLGMTFGPAVGGFLALRNYAWLFVADGGTCLVAAGMLWAFFHGVRTDPPVSPPDRTRPERSPWRDPLLLALLFLMALLALVYFQIYSTYTLTLHDLFGFSEDRIGLLLSINTLVIVLFEMVLVNALRSFNLLKVMGLGSCLSCAGFGMLPAGRSFGFVAFTVLVWTVGEMLSLPLIEGVVANRAGEKNRGQYLGLLTFSFSGAFIVAPVAGTWVYERLGAESLWLGCGALGFLLWGGFYALSLGMTREETAAV